MTFVTERPFLSPFQGTVTSPGVYASLMHNSLRYQTMHSPELLKGTLQTILLKVLKDNGKMYGYEITQKVKELSLGRILLTEGALYPALHKLEAEGLLQTDTVHMGKRIRKYYSITVTGKSLVKARVDEFKDFIKTMSAVLQVQMA